MRLFKEIQKVLREERKTQIEIKDPKWVDIGKALRRKRLRKVASILACVVAFSTTYAMIMPAITVNEEEAREMPGFLEAFEEAETETVLQETLVGEDGQQCDITLTCGEAAGIPEEAELQVREIAPDSEEYASYLASSAEELGVEEEGVTFARFFDIEILQDGEKIEPEAAVSVSMQLADPQNESDAAPEILHFTEDGPVTMDAEENEEGEICFDTDSFSVYGVIVGNGGGLPDDLAGQTVKIKNGNNYLTGTTNYNDNPWRINKTNDVNSAAEYTFEATGTPGEYSIYTLVGGEKQYLHFNRISDNQANVNLTNYGPMPLTVTRNGDGTYGISRTENGTAYYLNQYSGDSGNGFAGWIGDNDGNSKLTFVTGQSFGVKDGEKYMVLIKRVENIEGENVEVFYIVNNDGTLTPVRTEFESDGSVKCVYVEEPMLWTYSNNHLYHDYDAYSFDVNSSPEEFLYRYLNPGDSNGLTTENSSNINRYWSYDHMQTNLANVCQADF